MHDDESLCMSLGRPADLDDFVALERQLATTGVPLASDDVITRRNAEDAEGAAMEGERWE